ncbi:MAG: hypothetical protein K6C68_11760 [Ruminococcus sp.]|nr:hypothetical protein [Ruminococcus sp.]
MKKIVTGFAAALMSLSMMLTNFTAVAASDVSDVEIDCSGAKEVKSWNTSMSISSDEFDATRLTEDSVLKIEYEITEKIENDYSTGYPVECIFQSWEGTDAPGNEDGNIWAKIAPSKFDDTSAEYTYKDITTYVELDDGSFMGYGTTDFSRVSCILFGATADASIIIKKATFTNCLPESEGKHWVDPETVKKEKEQEKKSNMKLVIGIGVGILIAAAAVFFLLSHKSKKAFDVTTGQYVDKKKIKRKKYLE